MHEDRPLTPLETFRRLKRTLAEAAQQRLGAELDLIESELLAAEALRTGETPPADESGEPKPTVRGNPPPQRRTGA